MTEQNKHAIGRQMEDKRYKSHRRGSKNIKWKIKQTKDVKN